MRGARAAALARARELLLYGYGVSYQEIAQLTGASYTAVNRWHTRGRNALRPRAASSPATTDGAE